MFMSREAYEENERARAAAMLNPSPEAALQWWDPDWELPNNPNVLLAAIHYMRLQWEQSTPEMIRRSRSWLLEHGYRLRLQPIPLRCQ